MDFVSCMEREGKTGGYIVSNLKAVKSWLSHNRVEYKRRIKVKCADDTPAQGEANPSRGPAQVALPQLPSPYA